MEHNAYPVIMSFVIRFVMDESTSVEEFRHAYRGTIRHIQSNEELNFNTWDDVGEFIRRYVPLETESGQSST